MFESVLKKIREKVWARQYVMTLHAEEEMDSDGLTIFDVEHGIITGKITERQKDYQTGEAKYLIKGKTLSQHGVVVVTKLGITGKLVILTVYLE